jgi:hypothetical protein
MLAAGLSVQAPSPCTDGQDGYPRRGARHPAEVGAPPLRLVP